MYFGANPYCRIAPVFTVGHITNIFYIHTLINRFRLSLSGVISMNKYGIAAAGLVATIVGVVVALMVGYTLFPSISDAAKKPTGNTTAYTTSETSFLSLGTLFLALGLGVLGLKLLTE